MENQIEEMAKIAAKRDDTCMAASIASAIYRAGYRKASEVAAEIIEAVEKIILENTYPSSDYNKKPVIVWKTKNGYDALEELKKKYMEKWK